MSSEATCPITLTVAGDPRLARLVRMTAANVGALFHLLKDIFLNTQLAVWIDIDDQFAVGLLADGFRPFQVRAVERVLLGEGVTEQQGVGFAVISRGFALSGSARRGSGGRRRRGG